MNKKDNPKKINDNIELDIETQSDFKKLASVLKEIQTRRDMIVIYYSRGKGKSGDYRISKDFTHLEEIEKGK